VNPNLGPATPFARAGTYYARAWRRYVLRRPTTDIPVARPTVALASQALVDELLLSGFRATRVLRKPADLARLEREAGAAAALYEQRGWLARPEGFFVAPPPLPEPAIRMVTGPRRTYERVSFDSEYAPHPGEPGRDRWFGYAANRRARAWMLRHDDSAGPRPWIIVVHGALMGRPMYDIGLLRARWLHHDLGLNVILPVLPLHGPRRRGSLPIDSEFPSDDVLDNVHATSQAVWDIRRLVSWIRSQDPDARIGITGVSLGGYVTSLVASVEDGLECAIVGVPAVDLIDLVEYHGRFTPSDERRRVVAMAKHVARVVSPLALTPRVPANRRFVYAGVADRLVHPRRQVVRLWEHWGRPEIIWFEGSHIGFMYSKPVGRFVRQALTQSGLVGATA
jgi:dienelactone hydrolase